MNKTKTDTKTFDKKYNGTAPLNWCPSCGHQLISSQIGLNNDSSISGKICKVCGYIHNPTYKLK